MFLFKRKFSSEYIRKCVAFSQCIEGFVVVLEKSLEDLTELVLSDV